MKIAIDISSITDKAKDAHRVRGIGSYTHELVSALERFAPQDQIIGFTSPAEIPPDAEVIHYPYFDPFFFSLPFIKTAKTVVTVHDFIPLLYPEHFPAGILGSLRWQVQRVLLGKMDGVISVSNSTMKDCIRLTGVSPTKIHTIYSAGAEAFATKASKHELAVIRSKYNLPDIFILYVGDATWNKNVPRLLKAASTTGIPLVLVGKALAERFDPENRWNSDLVEIHALANTTSSFKRLGYVPQKDLVGIYQSAQMLVMPSLYEGFGFPILEAMMAGCPVITSSQGAIPEIAGNAALFVDPESVESISGGIRALAKSKKQRNQLIEEGVKQAGLFTWKKTAEETNRFYHEIHNR